MSDDSSETTSRADELDASLRFLLGGHVAVLTASELAALVQLRKTIGKVLDEAGQS